MRKEPDPSQMPGTQLKEAKRLLRRCQKILENERELRGQHDHTYKLPVGRLCDDITNFLRR